MLIAMLVTAVLIVVFLFMLAPMILTHTKSSATIRIPAHATEQTVTDTLTKYFGEAYAKRVMRLSATRKVNFAHRHGAYLIPEGTSPLTAMRKLTSGAQTPERITINGFRTLDTLIDKVAARFDFSADSLRKAFADPTVLNKYGLKPEEAMALVVNDTYDIYWSASPREVIDKFGKAYNDFWTPQNRKLATDMGLTPAQVTIIASIVDEETNNAAEKGTVGRLYINRYKRGMKLQADPTVKFALGDFSLRRIRGNHLKADSPYNTYMYKGLPPGPIRSTDRRTVEAVLNSQPHDYIYMCAKEDFSGTHNFASDYATHLANANRYQKALNARGIQ